MKNKQKICIILCMVLCCISLVHCGSKYTEDDVEGSLLNKKSVYFITKSTESTFWKAVYAGASAASTEYNMDLIFEGPSNEEDYMTQNEMIKHAIQEEADAIIISAVDYEKNARLIDEASKKNIKIVVIDSDVNSEHVKCRIGTDNYQAGCIAAQAALEQAEADHLNVGIINFDKITENGQSREKGFREEITKNQKVQIVDSVNIPSSVEESKFITKKMLREHPEMNVIVAFNEIVSVGAGQAVDELGVKDKTVVVAFDSHTSCIDFLETGVIDALVVQSPYAMGYLGVENAHNIINGKEHTKDINTAAKLVTKENMYSEENQRILFAFE